LDDPKKTLRAQERTNQTVSTCSLSKNLCPLKCFFHLCIIYEQLTQTESDICIGCQVAQTELQFQATSSRLYASSKYSKYSGLHTGLYQIHTSRAQNKKVQQKCNSSRFLYCFTYTKILTRSRHPG
jgi:hypothetical protein